MKEKTAVGWRSVEPERDDGLQQRSLADCKIITEEHFDLQHISSPVFVVS